jgi:hypothetical protein
MLTGLACHKIGHFLDIINQLLRGMVLVMMRILYSVLVLSILQLFEVWGFEMLQLDWTLQQL